MSIVAVFAPSYPPAVNGGGPIRSVEAMVENVPQGVVPVVFTSDRDLGMPEALSVPRNQWLRKGSSFVWYATANSLVKLGAGLLRVRSRRPCVLHFNSFFSPRFTIIPLLLWRFGFWGRPELLIAPRGEFGSSALTRHALRKKTYIGIFTLLGIHRSVVWHSTAAHETEDIRRQWGEFAKVIVRENHTLLPPEPLPLGRSSEVGSRFVFLGRIVDHKGLAVVLQALAATTSEVSLDIYGPEEDSAYAAHCRVLLNSLPGNVRVTFMGTISHEQVRRTLNDYDALLMPTAGENFGHVIAEALSASCPVIVTPFTPWTEAIEGGGGVIVANRDPARWLEAIETFAMLDPLSRSSERMRAGDAYSSWYKQTAAPHVWTTAISAIK